MLSEPRQAAAPPDPVRIAESRRTRRRVVLVVGGVRHEVMWRLLERRPLTRLGMLAKVDIYMFQFF